MSSLRPMVLAAALAAPAAHAAVPTVEVAIDSSPEGVRLVLTHSRRVSYEIEAGRGRLRVRYTEPIALEPDSRRLEGRILEGYRLRDDGHVLMLETGPDFAGYETFELRNPFRLVLDLTGTPRAPAPEARERKRERLPPQEGTIVVLDPGHGGIEHGAVGPMGLMEKDVTLLLARRLKHALERGDRPVSVVLTRDEDRLVGLDERTAVANHNRADLFLSIHVNASPSPKAAGAETYYLSTDPTDETARRLAAAENRTLEAGALPHTRVREGSVDLVLWDLAQNQYLHESSALAESIQAQLNRLSGARDRGVRQAPFRVLMGAMMPAVLVEVGFISNPAEEERLGSPQHGDRLVEALATAVEQFLANLERVAPPRALPGRP